MQLFNLLQVLLQTRCTTQSYSNAFQTCFILYHNIDHNLIIIRKNITEQLLQGVFVYPHTRINNPRRMRERVTVVGSVCMSVRVK